MKKIKRMLTAFGVVTLGFLSSCSGIVSSSDSSKGETAGNQNLNVEQLDLIASLTENSKYFNTNYVSTISGLQSEDKVHLIITMEQESLSDLYENGKSDEYESLADFASSEEGVSYSKSLISAQNALIKRLKSQNLIEDVTHQYTTLLNGFGVETTYGTVTNIEKTSNVYDVAVSEAYALPQTVSGIKQDVTTNVVNVYDTGIFDSSDVDFDGSNTVVAILDSGFDTHHTVFQNIPEEKDQLLKRSDIEAVIDDSVAARLTSGLKASDVYVNGKIPFAYDYADHDPVVDPLSSEHGTHVAGIIAGKDDTITGVATNAQLVLMKVFSDFKEGANTDDILAGLEDAVLLGVDAINMSLGTSCGFTRPTDEDYLNKVYDSIESAGISLIVAASNSYSAGFNSAGGNTNKVTSPDAGTVGSPSTYEGALSVASISGVKSSYVVTDEGYTFYYNEANNSAGVPYVFSDMLNLPETGSVTYEYVTVPGAGLNINYSTIDVKGKFALIRRGTNSFEDKARIAAEHGAIGAILYNNVSGEISMSAGNDLSIPYCSISQDDGEVLASKASGKLTFSREQQAGPFMSDFSSWGPTPDLKLKPEITAHGGNILSAVPGNKYNTFSGTSMASPNMCGAIVLIRQYVKEKFPELKPTEVNSLSMQLLMSTATIALDQYGNPYSPRKQGAGLASLKEATTTQGYITVDGTNRSKLELGDDPKETGVYKLKYNIVNMGDSVLSYTIGNQTMTESVSTYDSNFVAEHATMLNPSQSVALLSDNGSLLGDVVTVPANSTVTIEQTITLSASEKRTIKELFPNGMYVEGFTCLEDNTSAGIDLNAPYLAFFGDWTKAPIFDKTFYEVESTAHNQAIDDDDKIKADYYATTPYGTYYYNYIIPLGAYVYDIPSGYDAIPASEEHAAISDKYYTIGGITTVYAGMMRGGKEVITKITDDATGEVIYYHVNHDQIRSYNGYPSTDLLNITSSELGLKNNSTYTFSMYALLDYGDGGAETNLNNTFSFKFTADNEAPIVKNVKYESEYDRSLRDYRYYLTVDVYDNNYAMDIRPFILQGGSLVDLSSLPIPVYGTEKGGTTSVRFEITDYIPSLANGSGANGVSLTNGIGIMVEDYALNSNYYFVNLPGTDVDYDGSISFVNSEGLAMSSVSGNVGDTIDLTQYMTSSSETFKTLTDSEKQKYFSTLDWSSSNQAVAIVKNGQVDCLSAGTATITGSYVTTDGYVKSVTIRVIVKRSSNRILKAATSLKDIEFTYFETEFAYARGSESAAIGTTGSLNYVSSYSGSISMYPGEKIYMHYEIDPWNLQGYELTWASSNPNVLTVDQDGHVVAVKEGSSTLTLRISINGVQSSILASKRITVKSPFIVENSKLTGYKGMGDENGVVEIPEKLNITEISDYAFSLYTTDMSIIVDEDDYDANKIPEGNPYIKKVVVPYSVNTLGKYAFYNCTNLEEVEFKINPNATPTSNQNITTINQYAFQNCTSLKKVNIGTATVINKGAFDGCIKLEEADLTNVYALAENAFRNCTSLKEINITSLRNAGVGAFENCTSLKTVVSGKYTKLSENMFKGSGLEEITVYSDRIPAGCFEDCASLRKVSVENDMIFVGQNAFRNDSKLSDITFKGAVEYFDNEAFASCTSLTTFTLPSSNIILEDDVFSGCSNLQTLVLASKTFIEKLGTSVIPESVSVIDVATDNTYYKSNSAKTILSSADGKVIYLVAPSSNITSFVYSDEFSGLESIASGAFSSIKGLTSVDLSGATSLKSIGNNAFEKNSNLVTVLLPNGLESIGNNAFNGTGLTEIVLPSSLKTIGNNALSNTSITSITLPSGVKTGSNILSGTRLVAVNVGENVTIGAEAFANLTSLSNVNFVGNGNVTVGNSAFAGCTTLAIFDFTKLTGEIGDSAFNGDYSLTTIDLSNVDSIGDSAFYGISNSNMKVTLGNSVSSIGKLAFASSRMSEITIPSNVSYIGDSAFENCARLRTVTNLSSLLTEISSRAFAGCTALSTANIGDKITSIGSQAFYGDSILATVNGSGITVIGAEAFCGATKLSNIKLSKVTDFGKGSFYAATALVNLDLTSALVIDDYAFLSASSIKTVNMPNVKHIGKQAFSGLDLLTVEIPSSIEFIGVGAFFNNIKLASFTNYSMTTSSVNDYCEIVDGVLYVKMDNGKFALNCYPSSKADVEFVMMDEATYIQSFAVSNVRNLSRVTLSNALVRIGTGAFYGTSNLNKVTFRSTNAPVLEAMTIADDTSGLEVTDYSEQISNTILYSSISYDESSEAYKLLTKYLNFNGDIVLGYNQFVGYVGTISKLSISVPSNYVASSYSTIPYLLYFDLDKINTVEVGETLNKNSLNYINLVESLPEKITLKDEDTIFDARTAYNALNQDLTKFGYKKNEVDALATKLDSAYEDYCALRRAQVSSTYDYLVDDINALGSFSIEKLDEYLAILRNVNRLSEDDRQYLDTTKLDAFQAEFNAYTSALDNKVTNSQAVNKIGEVAIAVTASVSALVAAAGIALIVSKKKGGAAL